MYTASMIFNRILSDKHNDRDWFKKNVLDGFATKEVDLEWLRKQFVKSARINEGFSYNDWKHLVVNGDGQERANELLYCLRLLFTELYYNNNKDHSPVYVQKDEIIGNTDINGDLENTIRIITDKFLDKYGLRNS